MDKDYYKLEFNSTTRKLYFNTSLKKSENVDWNVVCNKLSTDQCIEFCTEMYSKYDFEDMPELATIREEFKAFLLTEARIWD